MYIYWKILYCGDVLPVLLQTRTLDH